MALTVLINFKIFFLTIFVLFNLFLIFKKKNKIKNDNIKRIGIVGLRNINNIGNNLVKYSMFMKLKEYGFKPVIIGISYKKHNLYFLKKHLYLKEIYKFSELNESDYDLLIVNSDQTWHGDIKYVLNQGFLKFAKYWKIPRFVYGASLGNDYWNFPKKFDIKAKQLLKKFNGISVREKGAINLAKKHLGIKPILVLDPTLIINKNYYINLIKNFKKNFNFNKKYLCIYQLDRNIIIENFIKNVSKKFNYTIYKVYRSKSYYIENFLFSINVSKAIITDSYHGTIFSIIFNKPFISFINNKRGKDRFISLIETFQLQDRIILPKSNMTINYNLLIKPLNINQSLLNDLKDISINYLEKNLYIIKNKTS